MHASLPEQFVRLSCRDEKKSSRDERLDLLLLCKPEAFGDLCQTNSELLADRRI